MITNKRSRNIKSQNVRTNWPVDCYEFNLLKLLIQFKGEYILHRPSVGLVASLRIDIMNGWLANY